MTPEQWRENLKRLDTGAAMAAQSVLLPAEARAAVAAAAVLVRELLEEIARLDARLKQLERNQ